ncbi:MAG: hypothetical protein OXU61_06420 [Gammaproteobacteria bacterium]|nr:hypothetical protein [Gammaproteobacteria bacterium]
MRIACSLPASTWKWIPAYEVVFHVSPPGKFDLAYHKDWRGKYGPGLFQPASFRFRDVDFEEIARATRN